jgi:peptidoglycan/LPS O-acetylase OafA/YrhL
MGVTWSLGIEEQFYLLIAILLPMSTFYGKIKWIVPACIVIMIMCPMLRIIHYLSFSPYNPLAYHFPLHFRADALSAGVLISWYYHFHYEKFKLWVIKRIGLLFFLSMILLLPIFIFSYSDKWIFTIGFTSIWIGYSCTVILFIFLPASYGKWNHFFNKNVLALSVAWVGFYSYPIYLFHFLIGPAVQNRILGYTWRQAPLGVHFIIYLAANIAFGYFISQLIEQPMLRWRDKMLPSKVTE